MDEQQTPSEYTDNQPNDQEPTVPSPTLEQSVETNNSPDNFSSPTPEAPVVQVMPAAVQDQSAHLSPGMVVLGWLTYAFWGWLLIAITWLSFIVFATLLDTFEVGPVVPYALAGTLVLLPIAFVTDFFYRRNEPIKKTGASMVIMIIHAVIFALFAIGWLISLVFSAISISTSIGGDSTNFNTVWILTGLVSALLYAATFVRTLNPFKTKKILNIYAYVMLAVTLLLVGAAIVGPLAKTNATKDDRRIEAHLSGVKTAVDKYIVANKKLPDNLASLDYESPDAESLVDDGLVRYKNDGKAPELNSFHPSDSAETGVSIISPSYRYQLCVTYKAKSQYYDDYGRSSYSSTRNDYSEYLENSSHPAGEVCYKLTNSDSGQLY